jgi:hypothetical protein
MNAGFTTFSLRYSSDEAYATLAVPVTLGLEVALALAEVDVEAAGVLLLEDDDGELLQAAAANPRHAMPSTAANRLLEDRIIGIPRR